MHDMITCPLTGRQVVAYLDDNYAGSCRLRYESRTGKPASVVFSTVEQAEIAAYWAILHDRGGYSKVTLHETHMPSEFEKAEDWFFS